MKENKKGVKRVLLLIPSFADEGGTQKMVYELGVLLSEKYEVYECSFDAYNEGHTFKNENKILSLDSPEDKGAFNKLVGYYKKAKRLRQLVKEYNIDVTISNLWAADLVNALSFTKEKKVSIGHVNIIGNYQNRLMYKMRRFGSVIYNRFDKIVGVNRYLADELKEVFSIKADKVTYINNFIVLASHRPTVIAKPAGRTRLVNFGRLNPIKNHKPLLLAFANLKKRIAHLQLVVMGAGRLHQELITYAKNLGLTVSDKPEDDVDVVFTGFHPDPHSVLCSSDVFVFSSQSEGFGLVLAEAMHAGLPIITSDCHTGGPHIILQGSGSYAPGRTVPEETPYGYLMPVPHEAEPGSIKHWEQTMESLLKDGEKQKQQAQNSKRRAQDFSREKIKGEWFSLIENL